MVYELWDRPNVMVFISSLSSYDLYLSWVYIGQSLRRLLAYKLWYMSVYVSMICI